MLLLTATTDKIQVITSAAATLDVHASYMDYASATVTPGRTNTAITTAATTDVLAAPAASTQRNLKTLHIRNKNAATATDVTVQFNQNATLFELFKTTVRAGEALSYVEGIGFYLHTDLTASLISKQITADNTGGLLTATAQPWFPTNGTLTVPAATTYRMSGMLKITSGATSHSTAVGFGGTATITSIDYYATAHRTAADTITAVFSGINVISATSAVVDVAGIQVAHYIQILGVIRTNAAGTLIPQFTFSANPTGTITIKRNTFFELQAIGNNTVDAVGSWA